MSMSQPLQPDLGGDGEGIPAADPGAGAPEPAEGFGIGGEAPDRPEERGPADHADPPDDPPARDDVPFRTPDPREIGPG